MIILSLFFDKMSFLSLSPEDGAHAPALRLRLPRRVPSGPQVSLSARDTPNVRGAYFMRAIRIF